ncbi:MAG: DUF4118 domain-containing protein [Azospirillum sp.]|nr:DUF4118 domain-containing protein [Azospirillum sp.]
MAEADPELARPSPDALLAEARQENRGRLKVFLGAAPGVGKTYTMLEVAQERRREGIDIAVAVVETHGRRETEALLHDLEVLPRRATEYRGHSFPEMDLDAVLARRPRIALVDELAHSNVPGCRHLKRWQDVEELLAAGIDVYTTLNVQHLESLNDVVERITGIKVRETLPDSVLQQADEIELVDLAPADLIKRLQEGKVYLPEQAQRAVDHFFSPGNLTALREMALRQAADRVDAQMVHYMRAHAIPGPWPARERILVCIGDDVAVLRLVRATKRIAERRTAPWLALYVETHRHQTLPEAVKDRIAEALRLAEQLGGETLVIQGENVVAEVLACARSRNVTQIVVGRPRRRPWWGGSVTDAVLKRGGAIDVLVVSGDDEDRPEPRPAPDKLRPPLRLRPWLVATGVLTATTGLGLLVDPLLPVVNIAFGFLLAVLLVAVRLGLGPAIFASLLSFLALNFFFTEPRFTLTIADPRNLVTVACFLVVAVISSNLASRLHNQIEATRQSARRTTVLYEFSRKIARAATRDDVLWAVVHHVAVTIQGKSLVLLPASTGCLAIAAGYPPEDTLDQRAAAAADWAWSHGKPAGRGSATLPSSDWLFLPMRTGRGPVGVLGVQLEAQGGGLAPDQVRLLEAVTDQAALAIERTALVADIEAARVAGETERLRTALLSSLSHDLRTPLVSILGASTSLINYEDTLDIFSRHELARTIQDEAERLNRFVQNLLDMTRLGAGALKPRRDWAEFSDIVRAAAERARRLLGHRRVKIDIPEDFPLLWVDSVLLEQVFFNLLDNVSKYTPDHSTVTVWARPRHNRIAIEVADQGPGIPEADRERVFDMFYRVRRADNQTAGTGLGLAICRGIIEAHGGTIRAASGVNDCGTAIVIGLPLEPGPKPEAPPPVEPA